MAKGFMGSQYKWQESKYGKRHYYKVIKSKDLVEHYPFEYDRKLKKWFPYGPGQSKMTLKYFKKLKDKRPIKKL